MAVTTVHRARAEARSGTASGWLTLVSRLGYAAQGVVYATVGVLALLAAFGVGGGTTDSRGAIDALVSQPFGKFIVGVVALGLLCYAAYRFVGAATDADGDGDDGMGIAKRLGKAGVGIAYLSLAAYAAGFVFAGFGAFGGGGGDSSAPDLTRKVMSFPFGQWLVGIVGAVVIAVGFGQFKQAYDRSFLDMLDVHGGRRDKVERIGQAGFTARGVVFILIGIFLIVAAWRADPNEARGLSGALDTLRDQPWGRWLLGLTAAGLIAFAVYAFAVAAYRRIGDARVNTPRRA